MGEEKEYKELLDWFSRKNEQKELPEALKKEDFRFILIKPKSKIPIEKDWQGTNNYKYDDPKLLAHIQKGGNYGVLCGKGNLVVIDFDNEKVQNEIVPLLPKTFTVKTGKGLFHKYFICDKPIPKQPIKIKVETDIITLADIQGEGSQVIAPNSIHPNGNRYEVVEDLPLANITEEKINEIFEKYKPLKKEEIKKEEKNFREGDAICEQIKRKIKVPDLMREFNFDMSKNPTECIWHSSENKQNFGYNDDVWRCFHCEEEGNVFKLYMKYYDCSFVTAKRELAEKIGIKAYKQQKVVMNIKITEYLNNATLFWNKHPFFYDKAGIFWLWDRTLCRWEMIDDVDMMNAIEEELRIYGETITSGIKNSYLTALQRVGRKNKPKQVPKSWVQFKNKIYDIENDKQFEATPEYFVTNPIPYEIGESEDTPIMDRIFEEWVGKDYVVTLYEIVAFCCLMDYPLHRIFCFVGSGSNGKGKFLGLLSKFLGEANITSSSLNRLCHSNFEISKLMKKLVCQMGETTFNLIGDTDFLKRLTGEDLVSFEFKHKKPIDGYNYAKLIISSNALPETTDKTIGFYRRWMIIDFPNKFDEKTDILKEIPEEEYKKLAKKCIGLLKRLLVERTFTNEGSVEDRMLKYEDKSNPLSKFLREYTINDFDGFVFKYEFREKFEGWLRQNGYRVWNDREIGLRLKELYEEKKKEKIMYEDQSKEFEKKYIWAWLGLKWKETKEFATERKPEVLSESIPLQVENIQMVLDSSLENTSSKPAPSSLPSNSAVFLFLKANISYRGEANTQEIIQLGCERFKCEPTVIEQGIEMLLKEGELFENKKGFLKII